MAMCSLSLESFNAVACRSKGGQDDVWLVTTVRVGTRTEAAAWPIGVGVQAGQGFIGPWSAGPYQVAAGETGVVAYTLVNLKGSSADDQETIAAGLKAGIATAVSSGGVGPAAVEPAIRGLFGGAGELLAAPAVGMGEVDCRGLMGLYVTQFAVASAPDEVVVETGSTIALNGTAPAVCGTTPQSTVVFSVRRGPNLFSQSTPVTALASVAPAMELFGVGMDGLVRYNGRSGGGAFGAWQVVGTRTFSQSAPVVALAGTQRKDVFAIGTDGVIRTLRWTPGAGWGDWVAVSTAGQFLPDTPVSALWVSGVLTLFAVDPNGVAQSISWKDNTIVNAWAPLPGLVLRRRSPVTVMCWTEPWMEVYAVSSVGLDYHTSRPTNSPAWGPWQPVGGATAAVEPAAGGYLGLTFDVAMNGVKTTVGMTTFRVDGTGVVNELGWTGQSSWLPRSLFSGMATFRAGWVAGVKAGGLLRLYLVDGQTGRVGESTWTMQIASPPSATASSWNAWQLLPTGPLLGSDARLAAISPDETHVELFVVDRDGLVQHLSWSTAAPWTWSVI